MWEIPECGHYQCMKTYMFLFSQLAQVMRDSITKNHIYSGLFVFSVYQCNDMVKAKCYMCGQPFLKILIYCFSQPSERVGSSFLSSGFSEHKNFQWSQAPKCSWAEGQPWPRRLTGMKFSYLFSSEYKEIPKEA